MERIGTVVWLVAIASVLAGLGMLWVELYLRVQIPTMFYLLVVPVAAGFTFIGIPVCSLVIGARRRG